MNWSAIGDFNIEFSSPNKFNNTKWAKTVLDFGLTQLVQYPTRVTKTLSKIIDQVYTTAISCVSEVNVPVIGLSDHYPITCTLLCKLKSTSISEHGQITYRSFKHFDKTLFLQDLGQYDMNIIETTNDPNLALTTLYNILNTVLSHHAPIKSKRVKRIHQP